MRVGVVEHAARGEAHGEQALNGLEVGVEHAGVDVHLQAAGSAKSLGALEVGVEGRRVDLGHHRAGEVEVGVLASVAHLVPVLDGGHESVGGHAHELRELLKRVGLEGVLAGGSANPDLLGAVAGAGGRPDGVDLVGDGAVDDVVVAGTGLSLDGASQVVVGLVLRREALAQLVHAQVGHELHGVEHEGVRVLVLDAADGNSHLVAVTGVAGGGAHPAAQSQVARTAAALELLEVEAVTAGGEHDALGAVVLLVALGALDDDARHGTVLIAHKLAGGALVANLGAGLLDELGQQGRQVGGSEGQVEARVPGAREARGVGRVAEIGEVARGVEGEGEVVLGLVAGLHEMVDVPVHGLAVALEVALVQVEVAAETVVNHGVVKPLGLVELHAPVLVDLGVGAAQRGGAIVGDGALLNGDRLEAVVGAGKSGGVAGRAQAAYHDVDVVGGNDVSVGDGLGHKGDLALARSAGREEVGVVRGIASVGGAGGLVGGGKRALGVRLARVGVLVGVVGQGDTSHAGGSGKGSAGAGGCDERAAVHGLAGKFGIVLLHA